MNAAVAALAVLAAVHLPQRANQLRAWPDHTRTVVGAGLTLTIVVIAAVADGLLGRLDVSAPTMEIAAGLVLVLWSAGRAARWDDASAPTRRRTATVVDALVPGVFPLVLTPPVGVVAVAVGARVGVLVPTIVAAAVAGTLALPSLVAAVGRPSLARLSAALGVVVGVAMMVNGVFDV